MVKNCPIEITLNWAVFWFQKTLLLLLARHIIIITSVTVYLKSWAILRLFAEFKLNRSSFWEINRFIFQNCFYLSVFQFIDLYSELKPKNLLAMISLATPLGKHCSHFPLPLLICFNTSREKILNNSLSLLSMP